MRVFVQTIISTSHVVNRSVSRIQYKSYDIGLLIGFCKKSPLITRRTFHISMNSVTISSVHSDTVLSQEPVCSINWQSTPSSLDAFSYITFNTAYHPVFTAFMH